jgi:hypothetical protein
LEWNCRKVFDSILRGERKRPFARRRLIVVVNGTHNRFKDAIELNMSFTIAPYTTRLRHGYVCDDYASAQSDARTLAVTQRLRSALGRTQALEPRDHELLARIFDSVSGGRFTAGGWERLALELEALTRPPEVASRLFEILPHDTRSLHSQCAEAIEGARQRCAEPPGARTERSGACSRIASTCDWEDEAWRTIASESFSSLYAYDLTCRGRWHWERAELLHQLRRAVPSERRPLVLVVSEGPDPMPAYVAYQGYKVVYSSLQAFLMGAPESSDWRTSLDIWNLSLHADIWPAKDNSCEQLEAVLFLGTRIFSCEKVIQQAQARLAQMCRPGCYVGASLLVSLNDRPINGAGLSFDGWKRVFDTEGAAGRLGWAPAGPLVADIPIEAAVRFAFEDSEDPVGGLSFGWEDKLISIASLSARWGEKPVVDAAPMEPRSQRRPAEAAAGPSAIDRSACIRFAQRALADAPVFARLICGFERNVSHLLMELEAEAAAETIIVTDGEGARVYALPIDAGKTDRFRMRVVLRESDFASIVAAVFVRNADGVTTSVTDGVAHGLEIDFFSRSRFGRGAVVLVLNKKRREPLERLTIG